MKGTSMSDQNLIEALEIGLYEDYLEKLEKKYFGGSPHKDQFQALQLDFDRSYISNFLSSLVKSVSYKSKALSNFKTLVANIFN